MKDKDRYLAKDIREAFKRANRYWLIELDDSAKLKYLEIMRQLRQAQEILKTI